MADPPSPTDLLLWEVGVAAQSGHWGRWDLSDSLSCLP